MRRGDCHLPSCRLRTYNRSACSRMRQHLMRRTAFFNATKKSKETTFCGCVVMHIQLKLGLSYSFTCRIQSPCSTLLWRRCLASLLREIQRSPDSLRSTYTNQAEYQVSYKRLDEEVCQVKQNKTKMLSLGLRDNYVEKESAFLETPF